MIEVHISNFQSIEDVHVKVDGFTCLVGPSGIGKSAIVRAIESALLGSPNAGSVRHRKDCARVLRGTQKCGCFSTVRIVTADWWVEWKKGDNVNSYQVFRDGEVKSYSAVDKSLDFLAPLVKPVTLKQRRELLQIAPQFDPLFLLDESGDIVAAAIADDPKITQCARASDSLSGERKSAQSERTVREKDIRRLEAKSACFEGLDQKVKIQQRLDQALARAAEAQGLEQRLLGYDRTTADLVQAVSSLSPAESWVVPSIPTAAAAVALVSWLVRLEGSSQDVAAREAKQATIDALKVPLVPSPEAARQAHTWSLQLLGLEKSVNTDIDTMPAAKQIPTPQAALLLDRASRLESELSDTPTFQDPPRVPSLEHVVLTERLKAIANEVATVEGRIDQTEVTIDQFEIDLRKVHAQIRDLTCPMCGGPAQHEGSTH